MRVFSGRNGHLYTLGDVSKFHDVPLTRAWNGWDWVAPDGLRCWVPDGLRFQHWQNGWCGIEPEHVYPRTGHVSFSRAVEGPVRVTGWCHTSSFAGSAERWRLEIDDLLLETSQLGGDGVQTKLKQKETSVTLEGVMDAPAGKVLAELPFAKVGVFAGCGEALPTASGVKIFIDPEGVLYEPCSG